MPERLFHPQDFFINEAITPVEVSEKEAFLSNYERKISERTWQAGLSALNDYRGRGHCDDYVQLADSMRLLAPERVGEIDLSYAVRSWIAEAIERNGWIEIKVRLAAPYTALFPGHPLPVKRQNLYNAIKTELSMSFSLHNYAVAYQLFPEKREDLALTDEAVAKNWQDVRATAQSSPDNILLAAWADLRIVSPEVLYGVIDRERLARTYQEFQANEADVAKPEKMILSQRHFAILAADELRFTDHGLELSFVNTSNRSQDQQFPESRKY